MDPFSQGTLSPSGLYQATTQAGPSSQDNINPEQPAQQAAATSNIPGQGPRNYKSRKYRPCDFCRARQVACKIEVAPPCQLCQSHGKDCTFVERPKKKRRPKQNPTSAESLSPASSAPDSSTIAGRIGRFTLASQEPSAETTPREYPSYAPLDPHLTALSHENVDAHSSGAGYLPLLDAQAYERRLEHSHYMDHQQQAMSHAGPSGFHRSPSVRQDSRLDSPTRSLRMVGETGEANPYLLRYYHFDEQDECTVSRQAFRRVRTISRVPSMSDTKELPPMVFAQVADSQYRPGQPSVDGHTLSQYQHEVADMFTDDERFRLLGLYFRSIDPYFPIFARSELFVNGVLNQHAVHALPLSVTAALYASALPFIQYDELLSATVAHRPNHTQHLYQIAWSALTQEAHTPRLSTIQAVLLILQRPSGDCYASDTPWKTSLVAWTVSMANTLGLHRDASEWCIPVWELALRKRLWHAVACMDRWICLGAGVPSHIRSENVDVLPLWPSDFEVGDVVNAEHHFRLLSELTGILGDITDTYFTVRGIQRTSNDFLCSFDLARPLRHRLREWSDSMSPYIKEEIGYPTVGRQSAANPDQALRLAFMVANATLIRALLRPVENMNHAELQDHATMGSRMAVRVGALDSAKEVVEFLEGLGNAGLSAFWHSWSRTNFGIASSFLMQLLVTAQTDMEVTEINNLIARWRWAMRVGASSGNGILNSGLLRFDGDDAHSLGGGGQMGGAGSEQLDRRAMSLSVPL